MNLVVLTGFLASPPRTFAEKKKRPMTLLDLKVKSPYKPTGSDWHKIVVYGDLAAMCGRDLRAGMMVQVIGCLTESRWREGDKWRKVSQVQATAVNLCFHRASAEFLDATLLLAAEQSEDADVEVDGDD